MPIDCVIPARAGVSRSSKIVGRAVVETDSRAPRMVEGRLSAVTQVGREGAALLAEGHPWPLSVGTNGAPVAVR